MTKQDFIYLFSEYKSKPITVSAIRFDGTKEMAELIEQNCPPCYMEDDFSVLRGYFSVLRGCRDFESQEFGSVYCGDYIVKTTDGYLVVDEFEFEKYFQK